jgi:DNA-binding NarL/FixJ family response regulator
MAATRVLLADDHTLLLGAFEKLLSPEYQVVGTVSDGRELLTAAQQLKPDVIVLDIGMPLLNGLEAGRQIKQMMPGIKLVFLTMNEDSDLAAEAFRAGASAYLLKRSASTELATAIHEVMNGRSYVTPLVTAGLVGSFMQPQDKKPLHQLTPRQREVLQLLAEGHSMKQVADMLNVTARTVQFHKYRMMQQLGIKSSAELVQFAVRQHVV